MEIKRTMYATITFKVKSKEEFEELKAVSQLPDEEWELIGWIILKAKTHIEKLLMVLVKGSVPYTWAMEWVCLMTRAVTLVGSIPTTLVNIKMETRICPHCKKENYFLQVGNNIWECNGCYFLF